MLNGISPVKESSHQFSIFELLTSLEIQRVWSDHNWELWLVIACNQTFLQVMLQA